MYKVIGNTQTRAFRVLWMLEELGQPYEHVNAPPRDPAVVAVNPAGKVPVPVVVGVSVNLPVWLDKYAAGVREAEARYWAALKARAERENTLSSELKMVLYRFRDAQRKVDLYGDTLVPKAQQSLKATEAAFRAGKA
ncbi:MAG: TolC family protein, partial [Nioella sp.]